MSKLLSALKQLDAKSASARPPRNASGESESPGANQVAVAVPDGAAVERSSDPALDESQLASEEPYDPLARIRELNRLLEEALASRRSAGGAASIDDADAVPENAAEVPPDSGIDSAAPAVGSGPRISVAVEFAELADRLTAEIGTTSPAVLTFVAAGPEAAGSQWIEPLAVALLQKTSGRMLVIEADTDHPQWSNRLGIEATTGLAEVLQSRVTWHDSIRPTPIPRLDLLARGQGTLPDVAASTAPLVGLLQSVKAAYAFVLVAAGPIDRPAAATLAARSDGAVLVLGLKSTSRSVADKAKRLLTASGARILGAIVRG